MFCEGGRIGKGEWAWARSEAAGDWSIWWEVGVIIWDHGRGGWVDGGLGGISGGEVGGGGLGDVGEIGREIGWGGRCCNGIGSEGEGVVGGQVFGIFER